MRNTRQQADAIFNDFLNELRKVGESDYQEKVKQLERLLANAKHETFARVKDTGEYDERSHT